MTLCHKTRPKTNGNLGSSFASWLVLTCLCVTGCTTLPTSNRAQDGFVSARGPARSQNINHAMGSGIQPPHQPQNAIQTSATPTTPSRRVENPSIAQASFVQPTGCADGCISGGCGPSGCAPGMPAGIAQSPGPIRRMFGAHGTDGCMACNQIGGACGSGDCQAPHGYVEFAPQGWNLYGVDPQEFICDGGDHDPRATLTLDDTINGLQPEDTVVHYTTESGDIAFQPSNRVCVYSPRFASTRKITAAVAGEKVLALSAIDRPRGPAGLDKDLPGLVVGDTVELGRADALKRIDGLRDLNRGMRFEGDLAPIAQNNVLEIVSALSTYQTGQLLDEQLALIEQSANAAVTWTVSEGVEVAIEDLRIPTITRDQQVEAFTIYDFPDAGRLRIVKMADKQHAKPGDEVSFAIRVQNVGDSAVNHVVITDNLVTRLAYVEDSQESDRDTEFRAVPNNGQSLRLEWKLTEELKVGESVLIEFRCKLR